MVIDVDEVSFAPEVVERSRTLPVVVDFWAAWCAPCRQLGPILDMAVAAREGEVVLAKVDVDANPGIAARFNVRGIPAVKAFRDGGVVREFTGALPRAEVDRFLDALLPSRADRLVAAGDEASLREALAADPGHVPARVSLARVLLARNDREGAAGLLSPVAHDPAAAGLLARLRLRDHLAAEGDAPAAATVVAGLDHLDAGEPEAAAAALLAGIREGAGETRRLAQQVLVGLFTERGEDDQLTRTYRPQLAAALF